MRVRISPAWISKGLLYSQHNYRTPLPQWCEHSMREWVHPLPFWSPTSGEIHHCPCQSSAVKQPSCHQLRRRRGGHSESPAPIQEAMLMMTMASRLCAHVECPRQPTVVISSTLTLTSTWTTEVTETILGPQQHTLAHSNPTTMSYICIHLLGNTTSTPSTLSALRSH